MAVLRGDTATAEGVGTSPAIRVAPTVGVRGNGPTVTVAALPRSGSDVAAESVAPAWGVRGGCVLGGDATARFS